MGVVFSRTHGVARHHDTDRHRLRNVHGGSFMSAADPRCANGPILEMGYSRRFGIDLLLHNMPQAITRLQSTRIFALSGVIIHEAGPSQDQ